jgi:hypothetical protein
MDPNCFGFAVLGFFCVFFVPMPPVKQHRTDRLEWRLVKHVELGAGHTTAVLVCARGRQWH